MIFLEKVIISLIICVAIIIGVILILDHFTFKWLLYKQNKKWKGIKPNDGDTLNPDITQTILLLDAIKYKTEGHCPCVPKHARNETTLCPCLAYRYGSICRCGLFVKESV